MMSSKKDAYEAINSLSINGNISKLAYENKDSIKDLEDILDYANSKYAKENNVSEFVLDNTGISLEINNEPTMTGDFRKALSACDALIMQYLEDGDNYTDFTMTDEQLSSIGNIVDKYQKTLFTAYPIAINVSHPLLQEIRSELENPDRKFTFMCEHDSNINSVLAALEVKERNLKDSVVKRTPVGSGITLIKLTDENGKEFIKALLIYQDSQQLKDLSTLDSNNFPGVYELDFKDIDRNSDNLYLYEDVIERFDKAIDAYNKYLDN